MNKMIFLLESIIDHVLKKNLRKIRINSLAIKVMDGLYRGYLKRKL